MLHDLEFWRRSAVVFATVGQSLFIALYMFFPWWKTYLGRALFFKAVTLGALLLISTIGIAVDWEFEMTLIVLLHGAVALAIWGQTIAFFRVRAQGRQDNLGEESPMSETSNSQVETDARNRAFRTLLQGLAFDVSAALVIVLYTVFSNAEGWGDIQWALLGFTLAKTFVVSGLSYLMRTVFASQVPPSR